MFNVRVEHLPNNQLYDQIMSRAFTALDNMVSLCKHLLTPEGQFIAMKGLVPENEIAMVDPDFEIQSITPLTVPGSSDQRHLITVIKKSVK